ncbi:MAG: hypothetical protein ACJ0RM_03440 [Alphaproteobacteria bacterium]
MYNLINSKIFYYNEWKDHYYDHLLGYLYEVCKKDILEKLLEKKINNLTFITDNELNIIFNKFGEMSIFKSELNMNIIGNKMWCEYCPLEELKRIVRDKYFLKTLNKTPTEEALDEVLELIIINEVLKIHNDKRYKLIISKFLN